MSEVSRSLHFWKGGHAELRLLAEKQSVVGRFVGANERWACAVVYGPEDEQQLLASAPGIVLVWWYADDYALNLAFHQAGRRIGELSLAWGSAKASAPLRAPLLCWLLQEAVLDGSRVEQLLQLAREVDAGTLGGEPVRDRAAAILGLPAHEWLSPEMCIEVPLEQFREAYADAEDFAKE
ncbi:MAG TPA: hypothetical protein VJV79_39345 [Polyangiaceae bacterium]|nr:hypothetical protein [Polyangiaceae bacterium]